MTPGLSTCRPPRPTWSIVLATTLAALFTHRVAGQATALQAYPVDWSQVSASPNTTRDLTANCNCDLREDGCDLGCCCDTQCPSGLTSLFTSGGVCQPEGSKQQQLTYCVPKDYVVKVNLPSSSDFYTIVKDQAEVKFFSELLCIASDSNPDLGKTYPDPPAGAVGDNVNLAQCPAATSPPSKITNYVFRSYVYAQPAGASSPSASQPLTLPYPALSAECNDQYVVGYLLPLPAGSKSFYSGCQRNLAALNLSAACSPGGLLSHTYYSGMRVLSGRGSAYSPLSFTVVSVQYLDPSTGSLTPVSASAASASFNATSALCRNAVRSINMTLFYTLTDEAAVDTPGYIDSAEVTFVVTDVAASSSPLQQDVRLSWLPTAAPQPIDVVTSGNPGYVHGFPLLAGTLASTTDGGVAKTAVSRLVGGLPVPAPGAGGACSPTSLSFAKYGANASSACSVSLTAAQLKDFCTTYQNAPDKYLAAAVGPLYASILNASLYVGEWGDSDYNNVNQWLQVKVSGYPFSPSIYSQADNACSGVIVGFDLQVVTGVAFSSNNLQQKVLYANLCFKTGVWDFPESVPQASPQRFYLSFGVSFIRLPQQASSVKKPAPPLVVPLPADIFYPFVASEGSTSGSGSTGDGGRGVRASVWVLAVAALAALGALQGLGRGGV